jgi:valyl-tRNA synthetase
LDLKRIIGYKQFCNKIWNSCKFVLRNFNDGFVFKPEMIKQSEDSSLINKWILDKLNNAVRGVNNCFEKYDFGNATIVFHNFFIYDFCDVYIEATKSIFRETSKIDLVSETMNTLFYVLMTALRLLHPMMPFLTEELY